MTCIQFTVSPACQTRTHSPGLGESRKPEPGPARMRSVTQGSEMRNLKQLFNHLLEGISLLFLVALFVYTLVEIAHVPY